MMSSKRYTDEFKKEAIKQVTERGYPASEVARRLGVTTHSLYACPRFFHRHLYRFATVQTGDNIAFSLEPPQG
jgi:transposase-like protein